jgi:tetratricopeptide (TPR) repeat protein
MKFCPYALYLCFKPLPLKHTLFALLLCFSTALCAQQLPTRPKVNHTEWAETEYGNGRYEEALRHFPKSLKLNPDEPLRVLRAAVSAYKVGKKGQMRQFLKDGYKLRSLRFADIYLYQSEFRELDGSPFEEELLEVGAGEFRLINARYGSERFTRKPLYRGKNHGYGFRMYLGEQMIREREFDRAFIYYEAAFKMDEGDYFGWLRMGFCAAMEGRVEETNYFLDKAFAAMPTYSLSYLRLHSDFKPGFENRYFLKAVERQMTQHFPDFDAPLTTAIDSLWEEFTGWRDYHPNPEMKYGGREYDCFTEIRRPDLLHHREELNRRLYRKLDSLISTHGVPTAGQVADREPLLLLMMQGAPTDFLGEHWDVLTAAVARPMLNLRFCVCDFAWFYDEACVREGKRQRYGTILLWDYTMRMIEPINFYPIEDPEGVDDRRAALGMKPLEEHFDFINIDFSPEAHLRYEGFPKGFELHLGTITAYHIRLPMFYAGKAGGADAGAGKVKKQ